MPDDDPRIALARKYLKAAETELAEKEAEKPRRSAPVRASRNGTPRAVLARGLAGYVRSRDPGRTGADGRALALLLCVHMLLVNFVVGRVIALPTGVVVAAVLGYVSVLFLGIVESTSTGYTDVDSLQGDWRDWFWTLPSTLGMLAIAAFIGWIFSLVTPVSVWMLIGLSALVLYPYLQLSSLETGSPLSPLSLPVLQSYRQASGGLVCALRRVVRHCECAVGAFSHGVARPSVLDAYNHGADRGNRPVFLRVVAGPIGTPYQQGEGFMTRHFS